jgi:DCN1-like protein 4/5
MPPSTNVNTIGAVQKPSKKGSIVSKLSSDQPSNAFSEKKAIELFQSYKDDEVTDGEVVGPEGFERFCGDAQLDAAGPKPLLLGWLFGAKDMARFTKEEWSSGTSKWR